MKKYNVEKNHFQTVSDNVQFSAEQCLLLEFTRIKSIQKITNRMNDKSDVIVVRVLFQNCQNIKNERED